MLWEYHASHCHMSTMEAVIFFVATFFSNGSSSIADGDTLIEIDDRTYSGPARRTPSRVIELTRLHQARGDSHISKLLR